MVDTSTSRIVEVLDPDDTSGVNTVRNCNYPPFQPRKVLATHLRPLQNEAYQRRRKQSR
jgi:hypothetical protein